MTLPNQIDQGLCCPACGVQMRFLDDADPARRRYPAEPSGRSHRVGGAGDQGLGPMTLRERIERMLKPNADGLLPCPLGCDGSPASVEALGEFWVMCPKCKFGSPMANTQEQTVKEWNGFPRPLLRALPLAIEQRDLLFQGGRQLVEMGINERVALIQGYDAALLAILEGKANET